jgi:Protein of unknown function (DUF805)
MRVMSKRSFGARKWKDAVMDADTIIAHEMPRKPQRDTRRSWQPGSNPSLPTLSKLWHGMWHGRIGRISFIWRALLYSFLASIPIIGIIFFFLLCSAAVKRLHDINEKGWWVWLLWVPLVAPYLALKPGTRGENRFGAAPKGRDDKKEPKKDSPAAPCIANEDGAARMRQFLATAEFKPLETAKPIAKVLPVKRLAGNAALKSPVALWQFRNLLSR